MKTAVHILTWCRNQESLWANLLVFKTIRTGFPDAQIIAHDNASAPEYREPIKDAALSAGAEFHTIDVEVAHWDFIRHVIETTTADDVTFCDPDVVFWDRIAEPVAVLSGRLLPAFYDRFSHCWTHSRLHTSLLQIHGVTELREMLHDVERSGWAQFNALRPFRFVNHDRWEIFDTCAQLYHYLKTFWPGSEPHAFTPAELDRYDHLFCGTYLNLFPKGVEIANYTHKLYAEGNLRGAWRKQDEILARPQSEKYRAEVSTVPQTFAEMPC